MIDKGSLAPLRFLALLLLLPLSAFAADPAQHPAPSIAHQDGRFALMVDGAPYFILGAQVNNSSGWPAALQAVWPNAERMHLNTIEVPVYWEQIEPRPGQFDFSDVDAILDQTREHHLHLILLWFGTWKNGKMHYAPEWVKEDTAKYPRMITPEGRPIDVLSPNSPANLDADSTAFAALMKHLRERDSTEHTVLMMQVENEVGVLGDARDHSAAADRAFAAAVPAQLTAYLARHREGLYPDLRDLWDANGARSSGTWTEVFGAGERADEIFMAWQYAGFIHAVAARGKAEYDLPMYVNTWLAADSEPPGLYPSGGPEPRVMDVWKAAGPGLDFYAPDLYAADFAAWCRRYHRDGNPLYMPETRGEAAGAANVFYALGEEAGFGFSPFGIETEAAGASDPLGESYKAIAAIAPQLLAHQSSGDVHGFVLDRDHSRVDFTMNGYTVHVSLDSIFGNQTESGFGLVMADGKDGFLGVGKGFRVSFSPYPETAPGAGIGAVQEGRFEDGQWIAGRRLNGDENAQGEYWRFDSRQVRTEKVSLYRYE